MMANGLELPWATWGELFGHFLALSLMSIGGAITLVPDMHRRLVSEGALLSDADFTSAVALAQAAPGPNVLFVSLMGWYSAGLAGALISTVGIMLPSTTLALVVSRWISSRRHWLSVRAFQAGMTPVTVGLLVATGWHLSPHPAQWQALLLTVAVGSNYALFFDRLALGEVLDDETLLSIGVASTTTVIGFGVLAWSSVPVLHAFGVTVAPGALLALVLSAHAQIVADPGAPRSQQPTVLRTPGGQPLVNIQTPSAAGVSRNTYRQFDVGPEGAVLNNSRTGAPTRIGGAGFAVVLLFLVWLYLSWLILLLGAQLGGGGELAGLQLPCLGLQPIDPALEHGHVGRLEHGVFHEPSKVAVLQRLHQSD